MVVGYARVSTKKIREFLILLSGKLIERGKKFTY